MLDWSVVGWGTASTPSSGSPWIPRASEPQTLLTLLTLKQKCPDRLTRQGTRNSLSTIPWTSMNSLYIRTTNLTHLEAEMPGWADQTWNEEQPLNHPLGLQKSSVHQNYKSLLLGVSLPKISYTDWLSGLFNRKWQHFRFVSHQGQTQVCLCFTSVANKKIT